MMMKTWLWMMCLMWAGAALTAGDFNLYSGRPQNITLRKLVANQDYNWELHTSSGRNMGSGQFKAGEDGSGEITFELPKLELGTSVNCKLELVPDRSYGITFYSREPLNELAAALGEAGIYADSSGLKKSVTAIGLVPAEREQAKIYLLADTAERELPGLLAAGKTVIYFAGGDNELSPPREKLREISLEMVSVAKKPPRLSVIYNRKEFVIGYEGDAGVADLHYGSGHLIVVAPQLRAVLDTTPEVWLILKTKIEGDLKKWSKESSSER
ncbi:MAG: hypothetical protein WCV67_12575 [Victivallaceae bacterium]|jgi:hypothetical protein